MEQSGDDTYGQQRNRPLVSGPEQEPLRLLCFDREAEAEHAWRLVHRLGVVARLR
jgi:hypothetical protein